MNITDLSKMTGNAVRVVPFSELHLTDPKYLHWLNDMQVMRLIGREEYLKPVNLDMARGYVEELWSNKYTYFFAVYSIKFDIFVGTAKINYLNDIGVNTGTADVGIMIGDRTVWGSGIATDTLLTVSRYAFDTLGVRKLTAGAVSENIAVIKAFKKIGYVEEARLRKKIKIMGQYMDHVLLGCFPNELVNSR
jgi:ribosomal-protein-alanine N-acetyltransferase